MQRVRPFFLVVLAAVMSLYSCKDELSVTPHDGRTFQQATSTIQGLKAATLGNYGSLIWPQGSLPYRSYTSMLLNAGEMGGDNVMMGLPTPDPLEYNFDYKRTASMDNLSSIWQISYKIIYGVNQTITGSNNLIKNSDVSSDDKTTLKQIKGENLFLRAKTYFDLVRIFGRPYIQNPDENLGVPIVTEPNTDAKKPRATVKAVYNQVVKDLQKADSLMTTAKSSSYASKQVAQGLLSRVYLYMKKNQKVVDYSDKVINSGRYKLLSAKQYPDMFSMSNESNSEIIFATHFDKNQNLENGSYVSMYYQSPDGQGWGEMHASKPLRKLLNTHPNDVRHAFIETQYIIDSDGDTTGIEQYNGFDSHYLTKFSGLYGEPMMSSPPYIRYAEMFLNRAEAYAKLDMKSKAITDVNRIRKRVGLQDSAMYNVGAMSQKQVLNAVLKERRMEFYVEGFRAFDIFRNNRTLKRDYPSSVAGQLTMRPDDHLAIYPIPQTAIQRNNKLKQNPGYGE